MTAWEELELKGRNVLLITDFNVPLEDGKVSCGFKIEQTMPTIIHILGAGCASLTLASHLGRPRNKDECSMAPIYKYCRSRLPEIAYMEISNCLNDLDGMALQKIQICDNIRYYSDEELKRFYGRYDIVINDAFGCAHRPSVIEAYPGPLMRQELESLKAARESDLVVIGGVKIADKLSLAENFNADVYLGGCLGLTVFRSMGFETGAGSRTEPYDCKAILERLVIGKLKPMTQFDSPADVPSKSEVPVPYSYQVHPLGTASNSPVEIACTYSPKARSRRKEAAGIEDSIKTDSAEKKSTDVRKSTVLGRRNSTLKDYKVILPIDFVVLESNSDEKSFKVKMYDKILETDEVIDIGPRSIEYLVELVNSAQVIFWNGPLGKFEGVDVNSTAIFIKALCDSSASVITGGGETVAAIFKYSEGKRFKHISTGGGSMLAYLTNAPMPGVDSLID